MAYTFNLSSTDVKERQISDVRDEIDDQTSVESPVEGTDYFLSDERIERRLSDAARVGRREANVVRMAAASVLDTLATNQTYILKVGSTLGETRDGAKVGDSIRKHAESLRAQVARDEAVISEAATEVEFAEPQGGSVWVIPTF